MYRISGTKIAVNNSDSKYEMTICLLIITREQWTGSIKNLQQGKKKKEKKKSKLRAF
jgi:hypothetical protein